MRLLCAQVTRALTQNRHCAWVCCGENLTRQKGDGRSTGGGLHA